MFWQLGYITQYLEENPKKCCRVIERFYKYFHDICAHEMFFVPRSLADKRTTRLAMSDVFTVEITRCKS